MAKQIQYDPQIIQSYAAKLYSRANSIVVVYTLLGAFIGFFIASAVMRFLSDDILVNGVPGLTESLIGMIPTALIGFSMGMERSFSLRLQAQTALCQVAIEANTRAATNHSVQGQNDAQWAQR